MFRERASSILKVIALPLLLLASASISFAHDTGYRHAHDAEAEAGVNGVEMSVPGMGSDRLHSQGMPILIVIVPVGGDSPALHWLLHHICGRGCQDLSDWNHRHMHWRGVPHTHDSDIGLQGDDLPVPLAQYD